MNCAAAVCLFLLTPISAAFSAEAPKRKPIRQLPGEEVQFQTQDGWTLTGTYRVAQSSKPTVILLHGGTGRRQDWYPLAARMARGGFGYLAFDLRGHGQSQNPPAGQPGQWNKFVINKTYNEWDNMREDVAAAAAFLSTRGVSADSMPLGGSDVGANISLKYGAVHPEVPFLFLLSPSLNYREVLTVNAMRAYAKRPIPILIVTAEDDKRFATEARLLYNFAKQSVGEEKATLLESPKGHGAKMFAADKELAGQILEWVEDPVAFALKEQVPVSTDTLKPAGSEGLPSDDELDGADNKAKEPGESD
jgi:predicted alpha/beta hydrolase